MKQRLYICLLIKGVLSLVFLLLVFASFVYSGFFIENQMFLISIVVLTPLVVYRLILKKRMNVSFVDVVLFVFFAYSLSRMFTSRGGQEVYLLKLLSLTCWYILFRLRPLSRIITRLLVICGVIQTILVILQSQFIIHGNHPFFNITGTFHNPAPLGGFLAISFIAALAISKNYLQQKNKKGYIFIACAMFIAWGLYLSDSRAAWLAVFSCVLLMVIRNRWQSWTGKKKLLLFFGCGMMVILFSILLYQYKPASANGRLFVWERSLEMIKDKPLWGHGINGFKQNYMLYQADYFEKNPESHYSMLADNVEYAYNELIKISVEMGIIGLILFLTLLFILLKKYPSIPDSRITYDVLFVLLLFSLFSYPSDVYIFLVLFCFSAANLSQRTFLSYDFPCQLSIAMLYIVLICMFWGIREMYNYYSVDTRVKKYNGFGEISCQGEILHQYHKLKYHPQFMAWFARQTFQSKNNNALSVLEDALLICPCMEIYCDLGTIYQQQGKYLQAKEYYTVASNMIPSRVIPKYKLYKLYLQEKDFINAKKIANQILNTPVKVESTIFFKIKAEIVNSRLINN